MIEFKVFGIPQTAGSKRAFPFKKRDGRLGVAVSDDNPRGKDWKASIAQQARDTYDGDLLDGPLSLSLVFYFPRPKGHFGRHGVKATAPSTHTKKPDVLKLARCVEDALTGVVWRDDSQIVIEQLQKHYGEPARVEIQVADIENDFGPTRLF